jgi:hypothetical protein
MQYAIRFTVRYLPRYISKLMPQLCSNWGFLKGETPLSQPARTERERW